MRDNKIFNYKIEKVEESEDWYQITIDKCVICSIKKKYGKVPKEGDTITIMCKGSLFGETYGMKLNGETVFEFTDEQLEEKRLRWIEKNKREKLEKFENNKERMDADYESLPDFFKKRIDKFRENNPDFRVDYEDYEMFCCKEAIKIASSCKTPEKVKEFRELKTFEEQKAMVPDIDGGHSGNTFGCAISLAYHYLSNPENIVKHHGALAPLVGSKEYGDVPNDKTE